MYELTHVDGRKCRLFVDSDGLSRLAIYRSHEPNWKKIDRQFRVSPDQIMAMIKRREFSTRVIFDDGVNDIIRADKLH